MSTTVPQHDLSQIPLFGKLTTQDIDATCTVIEPEIEAIEALFAGVHDIKTLIATIDAYNSKKRDVPESEGGLHEIETIRVNRLTILIRFDRRGNIWLINPHYQIPETQTGPIEETVEPIRTGVMGRLRGLMKRLF